LGDLAHHSRIAKERREAALEELQKGRFTVVGDLVLKVVEQAVEAAAAYLAEKHFHLNPRTAHAERVRWTKRNFPELGSDMDMVWGAYGDLGYDGLNGDRAREAVEAMERILNVLERRTGIRFR
jgi:hypothetical protein